MVLSTVLLLPLLFSQHGKKKRMTAGRGGQVRTNRAFLAWEASDAFPYNWEHNTR